MLILAKVATMSNYKVFVYLFSPANQSTQLWVEHKLEIEGVRKNTKHVARVHNISLL